MPHKTIIRLSGVARNPANGFPARLLDHIKHIGPVRAAEMIQIRPFTSLDDLLRIKGIGPKRLADIKAQGLACIG